MVSTRRQTASAATSQDTADTQKHGPRSDDTEVTSTRAPKTPARKSLRRLAVVAEASKLDELVGDGSADGQAQPPHTTPSSDPVLLSPIAASSDRLVNASEHASGDEDGGIAEGARSAKRQRQEAAPQASPYQDLMEAIFAGFTATDGEDVDSSEAEDSDEEAKTGEAAAGDEATEASGEGLGVLAWHPSMAMPKALSADAGAGALARKEPGLAKMSTAPPRDPRSAHREAAKRKAETAGSGWYDMKAHPITDSVKQDWRLLRLRSAYNPRHFYKTFDSTKIPKFFQMGEIVEGAGEFYSARMTKKERKRTLAEELLADMTLKRERNKRYTKLQETATKWTKKHSKNHPKIKRSKHRPKH